MSDYIEREAAIKALCADCCAKECDKALCQDYHNISVLPAADVRPVVLCKDCAYYNTTGCADGYGWCEDSVVSTGVWGNFFCGRAEKKGEADGD